MYADLYADLFSKIDEQWRKQLSYSWIRKPGNTNRFTVVQLITNLQDLEHSEHNWSAFGNLEVVQIAVGRFKHPDTVSIDEFLQQIKGGFSEKLREFVLLVGPRTVYSAATFPLIASLFKSDFVKKAAYCDSIVKKHRLRKSIYLIDLGSTIWHSEVFKKYAPRLLHYYQRFGPLLPAFLTKEKFSIIPILLNQIDGGPAAQSMDRYRRIVSFGKRIRNILG